MKRIFMLMLSFFAINFVFSQSLDVKMTNPNGLVIDTVVDATAEGPTVRVAGYYTQIGIVLEVTKISGTVAGKAYLQGGNRLGVYGGNQIDSLILNNSTYNYRFKEASPGYQYYRIWIVGTGTMQASYRANLYARKP